MGIVEDRHGSFVSFAIRIFRGAIVLRFCVVTNVCLCSHAQTSERCCEITISRNKWAIIVNMPIGCRTIADEKVSWQQRFDLDQFHNW